MENRGFVDWCISARTNHAGIFFKNDAVIYGKQVVMGIIILLSPTPGGSGLAEYIFSNFLNEFIPSGLASALGLLWRILSYYPYIFVGALILPRWLKKHFKLDQFKMNS